MDGKFNVRELCQQRRYIFSDLPGVCSADGIAEVNAPHANLPHSVNHSANLIQRNAALKGAPEGGCKINGSPSGSSWH